MPHTALLDVTVESLPIALAMLPSTYRIVGSERSERPNIVTLRIEGGAIRSDGGRLTLDVADAEDGRAVAVRWIA